MTAPSTIARALDAVRREHGAVGLDAIATFLDALPDDAELAQAMGAQREAWATARQAALWVYEAAREGGCSGQETDRPVASSSDDFEQLEQSDEAYVRARWPRAAVFMGGDIPSGFTIASFPNGFLGPGRIIHGAALSVGEAWADAARRIREREG